MPELDQPGLLFVAATLLPLASFVLLLLLAALRWALRPYAKQNQAIDGVFQFLGGEIPGRGPAFVALGAIAIAFVCSFTGFVLFLKDTHEIEHLKETHGPHAKAHADHKDHK